MKLPVLLSAFLSLLLLTCTQEPTFDVSKLNTSLNTANSWVINDVETSSEVITKNGISYWRKAEDTIRTFFYTEKEARIPFGMVANVIQKLK